MRLSLLIFGTTAAVTAAAMVSRERRERVSKAMKSAADATRVWWPRRNGRIPESETTPSTP